MKLKKKTKTILVLSSAAVLTLPALTLTSCSNISQYCIPVVTDGNPYTINRNTGIVDPYRSIVNDKYWGYYDTAKTGEGVEAYKIPNDKIQMPTGYLYTSKYNSNFTQTISGMFGYCNYNNPEWKKDGPVSKLNEAYKFSRKADDDWAWRGISDKNLQYISGGALSSYQNLNISNAITSVNTVTSTLLTEFNYMNGYLDNVIGQKKEEDINKALLYLFTGQTTDTSRFDFGGEEGKKAFYEYCLDNANLLSTGSSKFKFGPYNVGWSFKDGSGLETVGESTNPFLRLEMKDLSKGEYGFATPGTYTPSDPSQPYAFPVNDTFTGSYTWKPDSGTKNPSYTYTPGKSGEKLTNPYVRYTYKDGKIDDFSSIVSIPMLISPKHIQSAYYNPSKNKKNVIQPAEWLTPNSDLESLKSKLNKEKSWKDVKKNVNLPDLTVTTLTYDQKPSYELNNLEYASEITQTPYTSWMSTDVKKAYDDKKMDPRIYKWMTNGSIKFGDWVALANYGTFVVNFQYKYKEGSTEKTQCIKALLPYFTGFSAIFPAYMLFTNADCYKEINKDANEGEGKGNYYVEYVGSGIEDDVKDLIKALTDTKMPDYKTYGTSSEMLKNNKYMLYIWTFGRLGDNGTEGGKITSAESYYDFVQFNPDGKVDYSELLENAA